MNPITNTQSYTNLGSPAPNSNSSSSSYSLANKN